MPTPKVISSCLPEKSGRLAPTSQIHPCGGEAAGLKKAKEKLEHRPVHREMIKSKLLHCPHYGGNVDADCREPDPVKPEVFLDLPPMWFSLYRLSQMTEQDLEFLLDRLQPGPT